MHTFPSFVKHTVCIPPAQMSTISCSRGTNAGRFFSTTSEPKPNWPTSPAPVTNTAPSFESDGKFTVSSVTTTINTINAIKDGFC